MALTFSLFLVGVGVLSYGIFKVLAWAVRPYFSPLRLVPGPPNSSLIFGNMKEIWKHDIGVAHELWAQEYGTTYVIRDFFSRNSLYTLDPRAINHVVTHSTEFIKPAFLTNLLTGILGEGLLLAEGDAHRKQRRTMNPAFGPAQVRELTDIFVDKSAKLRDVLQTQLDDDGSPAKVDVLSWLSRATLDIIGIAGFNYAFDALDGKETELNTAFSTIFRATEGMNFFEVLRNIIPWLKIIPTEHERNVRYAQKTMDRIGRKLIEEKKAAIKAEKTRGHVEKGDVQGRDLLSLLVRANMAVDVPDHQRLSDEDMLAQIPTFLVAGHETTSTSTTWALFALTQNQAAQRTLRAELLACPTDAPTMEDLQALPYLDAVVREALRLHGPVSFTSREALHDTAIPLAEPILDKNGVRQQEILIAKGDEILLSPMGINRLRRIWGPDAHDFVPERWLKPVLDAVRDVPGVWGNQLTFLAGPRACIGYRFSLVEMKALLFMLVRAFEFELAVPASEIKGMQTIVTRPFVVSEKEKGNQMPLLVRRYRPQSDV